jgi:hypothetical protein
MPVGAGLRRHARFVYSDADACKGQSLLPHFKVLLRQFFCDSHYLLGIENEIVALKQAGD